MNNAKNEIKSTRPFINEPLPDQPLISVITVSYNHSKFIEANIQSVLAQGYPNFEHIIVDGGSTDSTLEILKRYSHLKWNSERDEGQADALNKGFSQAKGDIIVWLNSDDRLADGAFAEIIPRLKEYPVIMGACQLVDEDDRPTTIVPNTERTWFDFAKYWVSNSSPAQPSVVCTRAILEASKFTSALHLDPDLFYVMDYDLWLRMARLVPFNRRTNKILSIYPVYESSKTGGSWDPVYREMSTVYRRHERSVGINENMISVMLPLYGNETIQDIMPTLESLKSQTFKDFEVVFLRPKDAPISCRKWVSTLPDEAVTQLRIRASKVDNLEAATALKKIGQVAHAPIIIVSEIGEHFEPQALNEVITRFQEDRLGVLAPTSKDKNTSREILDCNQLLNSNYIKGTFAIRRLALLDKMEQLVCPEKALSIKELGFLLMYAGWRVERGVFIEKQNPLAPDSAKIYELIRTRFNVYLIQLLNDLSRTDSFYPIRLRDGLSIKFPEEINHAIQAFLPSAPRDWLSRLWSTDIVELENMNMQYPAFSAPLWQAAYLAKGIGDLNRAQRLLEKFKLSFDKECAL